MASQNPIVNAIGAAMASSCGDLLMNAYRIADEVNGDNYFGTQTAKVSEKQNAESHSDIEDERLEKFKIIMENLRDWLAKSEEGRVYHPAYFDSYMSNPYVDRVLKATTYELPANYQNGNWLVEAYDEIKKTRNQMIFWLLFLASIDDEIYSNELDSIIDIAFCMDFNEAMIRDWCRAVEYIMQGNRFQDGCNFECETQEGAQFFLHRDCDVA